MGRAIYLLIWTFCWLVSMILPTPEKARQEVSRGYLFVLLFGIWLAAIVVWTHAGV